MKEQSITVTQDELERIVYEEILKERHILYDMHLEDYFLFPEVTEYAKKGKTYISMSKEAWEKHRKDVSHFLDDITLMRELVKMMEPVYREYYADYEAAHDFNFDDYMRMIVTSYDADEFERVRDMFEEDYFKQLDEEER